MSTENEPEATEAERATRQAKKNSIPMTAVLDMIEGIDSYDKASFKIVGHRNGVRLAIPLTAGVSRVFFYGRDDYSLLPDHPAITVFSAEDRRAAHRGGIMAEVSFEKGIDSATDALSLLVGVVRRAAPPPPKGMKAPGTPRKAKAVAPAKGHPVETVASPDDSGEAGVDAHGGSDAV